MDELFVAVSGAGFTLGGKPFPFAGANNYYLSYKSRAMADAVLEAARAMRFKVIRTWAFLDRGALDGSAADTDPPGHKEGVYFQRWDPAAGKPAWNDGPDGLERLDYVVLRAGELGLKLILPLVNNWPRFGGMDQYVLWHRLTGHDEFYTDSGARRSYRDWVAHLLGRTNTLTGRKYRDEPAIMAWELANEPRTNRNPGMLLRWIEEMSAFVKENAPHQLVAAGDEGFLKRWFSWHFLYDGTFGGHFRAILELPSIDFGTFHMYPEDWSKPAKWGSRWIKQHVKVGRRVEKPVVLEEYGWKDRATRKDVFEAWHEMILGEGIAGSLIWMLAAGQDDGSPYPDYDGYTVYNDPENDYLRAYGESMDHRESVVAA